MLLRILPLYVLIIIAAHAQAFPQRQQRGGSESPGKFELKTFLIDSKNSQNYNKLIVMIQ
jgi:hypothetical protein